MNSLHSYIMDSFCTRSHTTVQYSHTMDKIMVVISSYHKSWSHQRVIESISPWRHDTYSARGRIESLDPTLMLSILNRWWLYTFVAIDHNRIHWSCTFWVWLAIHSLFGHVLYYVGTCLLTTHSHKRMHLSTRVNGNYPNMNHFRLNKQLHSICFAVSDCVCFSCCSQISPACDHHTHTVQDIASRNVMCH